MINKEILESEKSYVKALNYLVSKMFTNQYEGISQQDKMSIFGGYERISCLHNEFLKTMETFSSTLATPSAIGAIFSKFLPFFNIYIDICTKYTSTLNLYKKQLSSKRFSDYAAQVGNEYNAITIDSLLVMPIRRIPRYYLLLSELLKNVDKTADKYELTKVLQRVQNLSATINDNVRNQQE